jgi:RNA polymerase sigma-70 factor (ECF subfamily)
VAHAALRDRRRWFQAQRREIARERPLPSNTVLLLDPALQATSTPLDVADRREKEAWIRLGIELLDADDQEVIVLRQWQGLAFSEIGVRLGVSEDAARMRLKRALGRLAATVGHLRRGGLSAILQSEP